MMNTFDFGFKTTLTGLVKYTIVGFTCQKQLINPKPVLPEDRNMEAGRIRMMDVKSDFPT